MAPPGKARRPQTGQPMRSEDPADQTTLSGGPRHSPSIFTYGYIHGRPTAPASGHGRVVFTHQALPAVRLVNHLVHEDRVIVRTRLTATVSTVVRFSSDAGVVVADEADDLDPSGERAGAW